jgi:hypothetical protein
VTWLDELTLETVIVHLTDGGPSVKGIKAAVHDDCLVIREPLLLEPEASTHLGGDLVIPRDRVLFLQRVDPS